MITWEDLSVIRMCIEWFLHGIYSGIFVIYLQCRSPESRTTNIVFYALSLLYILSTATIVSDLLSYIIGLYINDTTLPVQLQLDLQSMLFRVTIVQTTLNGCCDFIAQCTLIYRCWIVWGKNTRVVIIPSFLAITYIATWIASQGSVIVVHGQALSAPWGETLVLTGLAASMVVNALVTGLIVFKILKVLLEVEATSIGQTLSSLSSTGGIKLRQIIFMIIESGMALLAIQLVRVVITCVQTGPTVTMGLAFSWDLVITFHQVLNGIAPTIILVRVSMRSSIDSEESFKDAAGSLRFNNPPSDPDSLQGVGSNRSMPSQERNEDNCFDNPNI